MASEWKEIIDRIGRWVDYENSYKTMDKSYMESVWWVFKELYEKKLIYEGVRISLYCPHCETPLSNFEIAMDNSYQEIRDDSVVVKFKINSGKYQGSSFLVWTTTPWTLPANTALAVGEKIDYLRVKTEKREDLIIAKERAEILNDKYAVLEELKGSELAGLSYLPLFDNFSPKGGAEENSYKVWEGDFVSTEEGTGIVHIAPAFGEDDFNLSKEKNIPLIDNLDSQACYSEGPWRGKNVWKANAEIIEFLEEKKVLYAKLEITHSYPFCYRCKTKLIYKIQPSWLINIGKLRAKLISKNEKINWKPGYVKKGRFLKGIQSAPDWNISRNRFWGTAMPVWRCEKCRKIKVVGSYEELYELSGQKLDDYHRPFVDQIDFKCECQGKFKRIPQVLDCWFESGSMPYGERHYPFENQADFSKKFPADYISEYIAQTRAWFYVLHVLAVALFDQPAFQNAVVTGVIAGEDGRKMSKSLGNYTNPLEILDKFGGDSLRFYLMSSPLMEAKNINFSPLEIEKIRKGFLSTYWNSYAFFITYARLDNFDPTLKETPLEEKESENILDKWIIAELNLLLTDFTKLMDNYEITKATRLIPEFVDKLSNWYIRRSRRRFWKSKNDNDKKEAYGTLFEVLTTLTQIMAPFLPFITEKVYKNLTGKESVHLTDFPVACSKKIDKELIAQMENTRNIIKVVLALRAKEKIKVRQPLSKLYLNQNELDKIPELKDLIIQETNIKNIFFFKEKEELAEKIKTHQEGEIIVGLDPEITPELKNEGEAREIVRQIQEMRRKVNYKIDDRILIAYSGKENIFQEFGRLIAKETLARKITPGHLANADLKEKLKLDDQTLEIEVGKQQ